MFVGGIGGVCLAGTGTGDEGAAGGFVAPFWILLPFWWLGLRRQARGLAVPSGMG